MNYFKIILISLIILFTGISTVCGENVTDDSIVENEPVSLGVNSTGFHQLNADVESSGDVFNLSHDYVFDENHDINYYNGVDINRNIVIDGNNHVIDGNGVNVIFNVNSSNVTFKNIVFKNTSGCAIIGFNSTVTTCNVSFINNVKLSGTGGGCFYGSDTRYVSVNDKFINCSAFYGSGICLVTNSSLFLVNASFNISSVDRGLIYCEDSEFIILNNTFSNLTSNYTSVFFSRNSHGVIRNCNFINLFAGKTGGAVAFSGVDGDVYVERCVFINSSSRKNGGGVYADLGLCNDTVYIKDCVFVNCSSGFGGAYLQLDGCLNIVNSTFRNDFNPVYLSNVSAYIKDTGFVNNKDNLTFDNSFLKLVDCEFINNGEIYIYNSFYNITGSVFNRTILNSYFDRDYCALNNNNYFIHGNYSLNQTKYYTVRYNNINGLDSYMNTVFLDDTVYRKYFDLRDYNLISPVKNQGDSGSCWAFAVGSAFESALLKMGFNINISINNIKNLAFKYSIFGENELIDGGNYEYAMDYFLSWLGPIKEDEDDYDDLGKISKPHLNNNYFTYDAIEFSMFNYYDYTKIKEALVKYGAVYASIYADYDNTTYYNSETHAAFYDGYAWNNHAVCIVGWDDTYSRENFHETPDYDGAWIVKNSWGDEWGDEGYYYVSYEDTSINPELVFKINPEIYNKNYQYDYISYMDYYYPESKNILHTYGNSYISQDNDLIAAVGTYFSFDELDYTINIYINDKLIHTQEGRSEFGGFNTIKLNSLISINKNDTFRVEITSWNIPIATNSRIISPQNTSYYKINNQIHYFPSNTSVILKTYTIPRLFNADNIITYYTTGKTVFTIENITGEEIIVKADNNKYTLNIKNNQTSLNLNLNPGNHIITTYYQNKKIINQILVKSTIECSRNIKVTCYSKTTLKIIFYDSNGEILKNKTLNFRFNNKLIKSKTNSDGVLKITLNNLKKKKYYIKLINPSNQEKATITINVISQFKQNSNMKMYYYDGSYYKFQLLKNNGESAEAGHSVKIKIGNKNFKAKSDEDGWVKFKIPSKILPGKHKINLKYNGESTRHLLIVEKILKVKYKIGKKIHIKTMLKKKLEGKKIICHFNGKKYMVKTNKKGVGEVLVKKPKKGKYMLKVNYYRMNVKSIIRI